jgi:hypothetical protein
MDEDLAEGARKPEQAGGEWPKHSHGLTVFVRGLGPGESPRRPWGAGLGQGAAAPGLAAASRGLAAGGAGRPAAASGPAAVCCWHGAPAKQQHPPASLPAAPAATRCHQPADTRPPPPPAPCPCRHPEGGHRGPVPPLRRLPRGEDAALPQRHAAQLLLRRVLQRAGGRQGCGGAVAVGAARRGQRGDVPAAVRVGTCQAGCARQAGGRRRGGRRSCRPASWPDAWRS